MTSMTRNTLRSDGTGFKNFVAGMTVLQFRPPPPPPPQHGKLLVPSSGGTPWPMDQPLRNLAHAMGK